MQHLANSLILMRCLALFVPLIFSGALLAQSPSLAEQPSEAFASENAILDTSIPFAIGAREARQALRGSFGWPSFQEGLVEGVYFRFDPDGYARFSTTPRLDVDVFEVICRPRTYVCSARKDGLELFLTDRGQLQMKFEGALAGDTFFVAEGVSEIQVPERILQPLDVPLELLLGSGAELISRRGATEVARVSLKGFPAVAAYLRWIAARQDYAVLPRGWPVPNAEGGSAIGNMTQPTAWNSPMPQPQILAPGYASVAAGIAPATSAAPLTVLANEAYSPQPIPAPTSSATQENAFSEAALRSEIEVLKQLILSTRSPDMHMAADRQATDVQGTQQPAQSDPTAERLLSEISTLQQQLAALQEAQVPNMVELQEPPSPVADVTREVLRVEEAHDAIEVMQPAAAPSETRMLEVLVKELGFDAATALAVLQMVQPAEQPVPASPAALPQDVGESVLQVAAGDKVLYENTLVDEILAELEAEVERTADAQSTASSPPPAAVTTVEEYQLLSRYFATAVLPALEQFAVKNSQP